MQKYINEFKAFYQKYRWWIVGGLFFLLMMQVCSQGGRVQQREVVQEELVQDDVYTAPVGESTNDRGVDTQSLLVLVLAGLLFYFIMKRKLFQKIMPSIVWISLKVHRKKSTGQRLARISIINKTDTSLTFMAPVIVFAHPFKKARKFQLKGGTNNLFPLTLTSGTSHQLSIDVDQFKQKAGIHKSYKWVKVEIESDRPKGYSSMWQFLF